MIKIIQAVINPITIILASMLAIYEITAITDNQTLKYILIVFAVTIELIAQLFLAYGLAFLRLDEIKKKANGFICLSIYGLYVVVFALLAGIGFFSAELESNVTAYETAQVSKNMAVTRIKQIDVTLNILNKQLETEAVTGYGPQSTKLMAQIEKLVAEQKELTANVTESQETAKKTKDLFRSLAQIFGKSENFFKSLVFGTMVLILYLGQILTAWRIDLNVTPKVYAKPIAPVTNVTPTTYKPTVTQKEEDVTPVTEEKIVTVTEKSECVANVTEEKIAICQLCGISFPVINGNQDYCCRAHRQKAYRKRKEEERKLREVREVMT